jgi:tetratricopeptide (TPR) repeat protein
MKGSFNKAINDLSKVICLSSEDAIAYHNRGISYTEKLKYNRAIKDLNTAIKLNPNLQYDIYSGLCKALNLKFDPNNKFSTSIFFNEFNEKIPKYYPRVKEDRELLNFSIRFI